MFKNAVIFRLHPDTKLPSAAELESELKKQEFVPCGPTQAEAHGWVPPRGEEHGALLEAVDGQYILQLLSETKMLPGSVVAEALNARVAQIEATTGRKPGRKEKRDLKEDVILDLLPKAFTKKKRSRVWLDPKQLTLVVDASTLGGADRIITALVRVLTDLNAETGITLVNTTVEPATAMSTWLLTQEPPEDFSIDRDCELKATDESKAVVRYSRHTLDITEVVEHIKSGKTPSKLAMTFDGRVSFVLSNNLSLKKIVLLDVPEDDAGDTSGFDADVTMFTREMSELIPALVSALGGEALFEQAASPADGATE